MFVYGKTVAVIMESSVRYAAPTGSGGVAEGAGSSGSAGAGNSASMGAGSAASSSASSAPNSSSAASEPAVPPTPADAANGAATDAATDPADAATDAAATAANGAAETVYSYPPIDGGYYYKQFTKIQFYDVSNPAAPELISEQGSSGSYHSSRLLDNRLIMITNEWADVGAVSADYSTIVPLASYRDAGTAAKETVYEPFAVDDIRIMPTVTDSSFADVTAYNMDSRSQSSQLAVLGGASTIYMSVNNLYLASYVYGQEQSEPYEESVYTITDYFNVTRTQIARIALFPDGGMEAQAQATVKGTLLNQFAMDEHQGNLRVAVTANEYRYRILTDDRYDVQSYQDIGSSQTNAIYVLSSSLAPLGGIEGLAPTERIYSVRFMGDVGYMVTYRQMDPLFAIDLSDPASPVVASELKIPGFSTYLHGYGSGLLFGLGQDADGNVTKGVKLSMFDVTDRFDVRETATLAIEAKYSEALYDHHAVFVDASRGVIGFPDNAGHYLVYGYQDGGGFALRASLGMGAPIGYSPPTRAFVIGDELYVANYLSLSVFSLAGFNELASLSIGSEAAGLYELGYSPMPIIE
jgi:uncharacterized secreted protein with C-terminal beta-propeller domain